MMRRLQSAGHIPLRKCMRCCGKPRLRAWRFSAIPCSVWVQSRGKNRTMYDLIVIGGGPAGTSAAITCACSGARVLLLERGRFPRHKVCGEFVSAESLSLLRDLLDLQHAALLHDAVRIPRARMFLDARTLHASVDPPAASIARFDLDAALWHSAESAGVDARQQVTVQSVGGSGTFRIVTASEEIETRALINASGRWSNLNLTPVESGVRPEKWVGVKAHFAEPVSEPSVDLYFFDGGYCGVQPVGTARVNASAMVRADVASSLPEVLAQHPALHDRSRNWTQLSDPVSLFLPARPLCPIQCAATARLTRNLCCRCFARR